MLVQLKRNWFAPNGVLYRTNAGLTEVPESFEKALPKDAKVVSKSATLPSRGPEPIPGFGAKPEHEQQLDLISGAAPTHQLTSGAGEGQGAGDIDKKSVEEAAKEAEKKQKAEDAAKQKGAPASKLNL